MDVVFDYHLLEERIREIYDGELWRFAEDLGIGMDALESKLENRREFTQREIHEAAEYLGFGFEEIPDYFFRV